jgi:hypothetical protein
MGAPVLLVSCIKGRDGGVVLPTDPWQIVDHTINIMGALAECWQTPAKPPSKDCPMTGIRTDTSPHIISGYASYHPLHRSIPRDKQGRGEEIGHDSNPGARPPKEKVLENSQSCDRTYVAGANDRLAARIGDFHFHSVFKSQCAGMSTPTHLFAFAKKEKSVPTLHARNQELELDT